MCERKGKKQKYENPPEPSRNMENIYFDRRQGINSVQVCRGYRDQAGRPEVESRKILILYLNKQKVVSRKQNIDADH